MNETYMEHNDKLLKLYDVWTEFISKNNISVNTFYLFDEASFFLENEVEYKYLGVNAVELYQNDNEFKLMLMGNCDYHNVDWEYGMGEDDVITIIDNTIKDYVEKHNL